MVLQTGRTLTAVTRPRPQTPRVEKSNRGSSLSADAAALALDELVLLTVLEDLVPLTVLDDLVPLTVLKDLLPLTVLEELVPLTVLKSWGPRPAGSED